MLSETDRRVLNAVFPIFLESFDAKEAAIFMEMSLLFTADEAAKIEDQRSSLAALREFYRVYSRKADGLERIEDFLRRSLQNNLIEAMQNCRSENDGTFPTVRRLLTREERLRVLAKGQVPFPRNMVHRSSDLSRLAESLRDKDEYNTGFFVVLHGLPGSGKTALATHLLAETDLMGKHFDSVCFLADGGADVKTLFYDLMVMLREDILIPPPIDISETALRKMIIDSLIDYPNLLVILDDVSQVETVREAERLGLRVLATTRDRSIFDAVDSVVDVIPLGGLQLDEAVDFLARNGIRQAPDLGKVWEATSGNPALLQKMAKLARGSIKSFGNLYNSLQKAGISSIDCTSSYRFKNLYTPLSESVMRLPEWSRNALSCASILPLERWIPLEVWELLVPIDVCEMGDTRDEIRLQLRSLQDNGAWLVGDADGDAFKLPSFVCHYLREAVEEQTRKERYVRLEAEFATIVAANGRLDEQQESVRDFFLANSDIFTFAGRK